MTAWRSPHGVIFCAIWRPLTLNTVAVPINPNYAFTVTATPTELHQKAFDLLGVNPIGVQ